MTDNSSEIISSALASQMVQNTSLHLNVGQNTIVITEDKVKLCLLEHLGRLEARREWMTPAGVLLTLVLTFATTSFKDFLLVAATWQAVFVIASALTTGWLLFALRRAWNAPSVDDVVGVMKRASVPKSGGNAA